MIPIGDKIIIRPLDPDEITSGGVILPDIAQEGSCIGEVVAVGPGLLMMDGTRSQTQSRVGDRVYYPKHGSFTLELESDDYIVIREADLYAIIPNKDNAPKAKRELLTDSQMKIDFIN